MRNLASLVLLLALCAPLPRAAFGQARPRRVGQKPAPAATTPRPARTPARTSPSPAQTSPRPAPTPLPSPPSNRQGAGTARPAETPEEVGEDEVVRVDTALVTIPVSIMDRDGRFIPDLRKEDFRILEDGVEQEVAYFATVEQPFTVALVIDTSGSTQFRLDDIQDAAIAFVDQLRPEDRVLVVSFDDRIEVLAEATSDRRVLRDAIRRTRTGGGTKLYEAVDLVIKQRLDRVRGRKAIVLFTDGVDTTSKRATYRSNVEDAEELDAIIYPIQYDTYTDQAARGGGGPTNWPGRRRSSSIGDIIGIIIGGGVTIGGGGPGWPGGGGGGRGTSREEYERGGQYLREMAAKTGGRHHRADDLRNIEMAFSSIAEELRRQYSLGYYPSRQSQASERRMIRVRVKRPNLVVRARDSYIYKPSGGPANNTAQDTHPAPQPPELRRRPFAAAATKR